MLVRLGASFLKPARESPVIILRRMKTIQTAPTRLAADKVEESGGMV